MFEKIVGDVNSFVWGPIMLALLVGTGIWLTIRTHFFQVGKFGHVWRNTIAKLFHKEAKSTQDDKSGLTPFQALSTALAGTIGTGNIVGVAGAIAVGGPGAVFWMWISAFFGMMTKFAEATLAVRYREKNAKGEWSGGPMYYITNGLGKGWKWLAVIFALLAMLASFGIGNITQVNSIATSVQTAFGVDTLITGIVIAVIVAVVIIGGVKRVGKVSGTIVPFMSALYIIGALIVLCVNITSIPSAFGLIFQGAFAPESVLGGVAGYTLSVAITKGVGRGVFSNEAGLGSAAIAHAATSETNPVKQGLYGVFEVFIDTIVVCSLTALTILVAPGVLEAASTGAIEGAAISSAAFATVFGSTAANIFVAIAILFFAFSTIIGWSYYGEKCTEYLFGRKGILPYKLVFIAVIVVSAFYGDKIRLVWDIADTLNGMMAIPNLIALLGLSGVVTKLVRDYIKDKNNFPEKLKRQKGDIKA